jgi:hypothetical protein
LETPASRTASRLVEQSGELHAIRDADCVPRRSPVKRRASVVSGCTFSYAARRQVRSNRNRKLQATDLFEPRAYVLALRLCTAN